MLCMPYFALFVQENTSKEQELPKFTRKSLLARISLLAKMAQGVLPLAKLGAKSEEELQETRH
ncbi:hypothetical protein MtrunA17_Chr2g0320991 [Medicago truncatula]|uniref:Uncharacterized protein n=1 Tax=Medicago truncatula TaxID=3880 RepID=A0A396JGC1_MEDTR|nr:hypothetical protein MtrunA17_Chr2g0320991 [Medicago truncatula]